MRRHLAIPLSFLSLSLVSGAAAQDWPTFRGGAQHERCAAAKLPTKWNETENLRWKAFLPGPGSSSPIVLGDKVFATCWSGYGLWDDNPGELANLTRHVVCIDRKTGKILWDKAVKSDGKDMEYRGQVTSHGYATPTPVADTKRVYAFFGRTVVAFDHNGETLWSTTVKKSAATGSSNRRSNRGGRRGFGGRGGGSYRWGIAASLARAGDVVIVNAEGAVQALHAETGKHVWQHPSSSGPASSPIIIRPAQGKPGVVVLTGSNVLAIDVTNGKLQWQVPGGGGGRGAPNATPIADGSFLYAGAGRGRSAAIKLTAEGDAPDRIAWQARGAADIPSPALADGKLYFVSQRATAAVLDAKTGEELLSGRLPGRPRSGIYSSPIVAGGHLIVVTRRGGAYVYSTNKEFELLAHNVFEKDKSEFNASPAVAGNELYLRSDTYVYCIAKPE